MKIRSLVRAQGQFIPVELLLDSFDLREFCLELIDLVVILPAAQVQLVSEVVIFHLQPDMTTKFRKLISVRGRGDLCITCL